MTKITEATTEIVSENDYVPMGRTGDSRALNLNFVDAVLAACNIGVFATLQSPDNTTTVLDDTYYPIAGTFVNKILNGFSLPGDYIEYTCEREFQFEIIYATTFSSDTNNTLVTFGIEKDGTVIPDSEMSIRIKASGDYAAVMGMTVDEITPGDTFQLVLKSDKPGAVVTVRNYATWLKRFF